jgi:hypothetical protein
VMVDGASRQIDVSVKTFSRVVAQTPGCVSLSPGIRLWTLTTRLTAGITQRFDRRLGPRDLVIKRLKVFR